LPGAQPAKCITERVPEARNQKATPSALAQTAGDQIMRASSTRNSSPSMRTQGAIVAPQA